jgi:hypothetical protein
MDFIIGLVVGILTSLLSSYLFLYFLFLRFKPNILISDKISKYIDDKGVVGYAFKFINKSKFKAYDVEMQAYFLIPIKRINGTNYVVKEIKLIRNNLIHIHEFDKKDSFSRYAAQIRFMEDIEIEWKDGASIEVTITAKHNLSGFSKSFSREYGGKSLIRAGRFHSGNTFDIETR